MTACNPEHLHCLHIYPTHAPTYRIFPCPFTTNPSAALLPCCRGGVYPVQLPSVLGVEGAGTVEALGPTAAVAAVHVGDRVAYFGTARGGSYAGKRCWDLNPKP